MLRMSPPQVTKSMHFKTELVFGSACWHYKFARLRSDYVMFLLLCMKSLKHISNIIKYSNNGCSKLIAYNFNGLRICVSNFHLESQTRKTCVESSVSTCSHISAIVCSIYSSGINRTPTFLSEFKSNTHMSQCEVTIIDPNIVILWEIKG